MAYDKLSTTIYIEVSSVKFFWYLCYDINIGVCLISCYFVNTVFPFYNVQGFWTKLTSPTANKSPTNQIACDRIRNAKRALHPNRSKARRIVVE